MTMDRVRIETEHPTDPTEDPFVLEDWISYDLTSDMMAGADTFTIDVVPHGGYLDWFRLPGHKLRVYYDDHLIFTGIVDATPTSANEDGLTLQLTGRDYGGLLVDSAAPLLDLRSKTLDKIVELLVEPFRAWIPGISIDNSISRYIVSGKSSKTKPSSTETLEARERRLLEEQEARQRRQREIAEGGRQVALTSALTRSGAAGATARSISSGKLFKNTIKAGETVGSVLDELCDHIGCRWWFGPDGTMILSRPEYQQEPIAKLYVRIDDDGNVTDSNCSMNRSADIGDRFATVAVVGQGRGGATQAGVDVADKYAAAFDPSRSFRYDGGGLRLNKTHTRTVRNVSNRKLVRRLARTTVEEKIVRSYSMTATVEGHWTSVVDPRDDGGPGALWGVDMVVDIEYGPKAIKGPHLIIMRNFKGDRDGGRETNITPIPTDIWLATEHDVVTDAVWTGKLRNTMDYYAL